MDFENWCTIVLNEKIHVESFKTKTLFFISRTVFTRRLSSTFTITMEILLYLKSSFLSTKDQQTKKKKIATIILFHV